MTLRLILPSAAAGFESRSAVIREQIADQRPLMETWPFIGGADAGAVAASDFDVGRNLLLQQVERNVTVRVNVVGQVVWQSAGRRMLFGFRLI